jgi:hypothetical protein
MSVNGVVRVITFFTEVSTMVNLIWRKLSKEKIETLFYIAFYAPLCHCVA